MTAAAKFKDATGAEFDFPTPNPDPATGAGQAGIAAALAALVEGLNTREGPYTAALPITPGTPVPAGRAIAVTCSVAGNLRVKLAGDTTLDIPVQPGWFLIDKLSVVDVVAANTSAAVKVATLT